MKKKLRLLLWEDCDRSCEGCCNKDWDLASLPICSDFSPYSMIMLTGGEPMLHPYEVGIIVEYIKLQTKAPIYLYTAGVKHFGAITDLSQVLDGITVTLHTLEDYPDFLRLDADLYRWGNSNLSLRLNVFSDLASIGSFKDISLRCPWKIKEGIKWITDCPLPTDEVFMRLNIKYKRR